MNKLNRVLFISVWAMAFGVLWFCLSGCAMPIYENISNK